MRDRRTRTETGSQASSRVPWGWLERRAPSAFATGGAALGASLVVPPALATVTGWAWVAGLVLVGVAVLAFGTGLVGLYPRTGGHAPRLSAVGVGSAAVAGAGALGLVAMGGVALAAAGVGIDPGKPMGVFAAVALATAAGLALALVVFGTTLRFADGGAATPALLVAGGAALLVPVAGGLLRLAVGVDAPGWLLFPALVVLAIDGLAVGAALGRAGDHPRQSTR